MEVRRHRPAGRGMTVENLDVIGYLPERAHRSLIAFDGRRDGATSSHCELMDKDSEGDQGEDHVEGDHSASSVDQIDMTRERLHSLPWSTLLRQRGSWVAAGEVMEYCSRLLAIACNCSQSRGLARLSLCAVGLYGWARFDRCPFAWAKPGIRGQLQRSARGPFQRVWGRETARQSALNR